MTTGRESTLRVLHCTGDESTGEDFAPIIALVRVFGRINDALRRVVKPHGLTVPFFEVLIVLIKYGEGVSQQVVSKRLLVTKGNISIILKKMEAKGLIERRSNPTDQRFHLLYVTDAGRSVMAKIMPEHHAMIRRFVSQLSEEEQQTLTSLLKRVEESFVDK